MNRKRRVVHKGHRRRQLERFDRLPHACAGRQLGACHDHDATVAYLFAAGLRAVVPFAQAEKVEHAVGTEDDGSRWFGWYFCGEAVAATKKGISYILKDSTDGLTKAFYKKAKKAANDAGVNEYGKMVEVDIKDSCDYTFPTAGV